MSTKSVHINQPAAKQRADQAKKLDARRKAERANAVKVAAEAKTK